MRPLKRPATATYKSLHRYISIQTHAPSERKTSPTQNFSSVNLNKGLRAYILDMVVIAGLGRKKRCAMLCTTLMKILKQKVKQ